MQQMAVNYFVQNIRIKISPSSHVVTLQILSLAYHEALKRSLSKDNNIKAIRNYMTKTLLFNQS